MTQHRIVDHEKWVEQRRAFLAREKEFTRLRDELNAARRELPWERVDKEYVFETAEGAKTLGELFDGRRQLLIYHFMFGPDWEAGCPSCSFWADNFDRNVVHLAHRDVTMIAVSRAPLDKLEAYKKRMGWTFTWASALESDFNWDFDVSFEPKDAASGLVHYNYKRTSFPSEEGPGLSAFYLDDDGTVYHTYSTYARGLDMFNAAYHLLDVAPLGRNEDDLDYTMAWLRRRDEY